MKNINKDARFRRSATTGLAFGTTTAVFAASAVLCAAPANAFSPEDPSQAQAHIIDLDLSTFDIAGSGFTQQSFPTDANLGADTSQLDVGLLADETIDLGDGIQLPLLKNAEGDGLIDLGSLGALNSYSLADTETHSRASSGAVTDGGAVAVSPNTGVGADPAYIDLGALFDQANIDILTDQILDEARIELGALASEAESNEDVVDVKDYVIAGAELELSSPLVGTLGTTLGETFQTAVDPVSGLVEPGGALDSLLQSVRAAAEVIPLVDVNAATVTIDGLDTVGDTIVDELISTPIANDSGSISIDLGTGDIHVDLAKLIEENGSDLNSFDPNTPLIGETVLNAIANGITESLSGISTKATTIVESALNDLNVKLDLNVTAGTFPLTATGGVLIEGSLAQFAGTESPAPTAKTQLDLLGIIPVGSLLNPITAAVASGITTTTGPLVQGVLDNVGNGLGGIVDPVVAVVADGLEPVLRRVLDEVVTITINEQPTEAPMLGEGDLGPDSFTIRAMSVTVLPDVVEGGLANLSLASSTVQSAAAEETAAPVDILTPTDGQEVPTGDVVVTGTGEPNTELQVAIDGGTPEPATVDSEGNWTYTFTDVAPGEHTVTATDDVTNDSVTFTAVEANTDVNTADNTEVNTADNTEVNAADNTADNTEVNTADNTEVNAADNTEVNTADNTEVNAADNTEVNTADNSAENTEVNSAENTAENTEVNSAENTADNSAENTEVNSAENTAENTADNSAENTEVNSAENTADNSAENTADNSAENTEVNSAENTAENTEVNTAENTAENTADNSAENTEVNTAENTAENTEVNSAENTADNSAENTEVNSAEN
ncbi:choice-of-anchor G family protein, partial [Glutamicibacter sp. NPDC055354]